MLKGEWARDIHHFETNNTYLKNYLEFQPANLNGPKLTATNYLYEDKECTVLLYTEISHFDFEASTLCSIEAEAETEIGVTTGLIKRSCKITPLSDNGIVKLKSIGHWSAINWEVGVEKTIHPMAHIKLVEKDIADIIASKFNKNKNLYFDDVKYSKVQEKNLIVKKK